ncbi:MAG TPA: PleD family two-component system response regulator [Amaricoccus sp.]|uniref:PleD family two-component system response regulator n=1 Tax=Amaricoccus sp. TaxID=1872485 RepID=UPI002C21BE8E|nr:PleD family two-component system response regulator [Amaricoccus sp.]HMQ94736.1 PleD family two-component system response regulator [Amaricoccus sp.]HMR53046.1 PleD family two-component system response regulator [Amaricoccus sp.]HMR61867.1 PleD family two-component system response regulator [Amaricoccus sp.]HMT99900.1 PleD family two-component system response regulator [Amaricoccus sp.]
MSGRVLVVDDVATNRLLLRAKLSSAYYDVVVAENGTQALEMACSEQPDMIMLDVMMPDMDGFEVCAILKAGQETAHIPVIMVTALDTPEERIRGLEAGADDFLTKPFNDLALFARVRNLMRMKMMFDELRLRDLTSRELGLTDFVSEQEIEVEAGGPILLAPPCLLQGAEWDAQLREQLGLATIVTTSEREAMNLARLELPDCFVVHQNLMEGGDGLRLVSALRARPETRQAAVILVVENGDVQTAAKGLDLGASDYIESPFDGSELVARIRSQLRRKRYSDRLRSNVRNGLMMAVIDPLTGIYNRRYASQHMNRVMERARETEGVFAVMMIDLDKFKSINDRFGHDAGDAVLREFSRRLQENIRGVDLVARFGGEEFFVAMPDVDQAAAAHAAERIRRAVEGSPVVLPGGAGEVSVTVSVGVAIASAADVDAEAIIKRADTALFDAKESGRNRVTFFARAA